MPLSVYLIFNKTNIEFPCTSRYGAPLAVALLSQTRCIKNGRNRLRNKKDMSKQVERYLTFYLSDEEYGIEIKRVREIIRLLPITHVPLSPPYLKGVINLRGKVIPVISLRLKFGMPESEPTESSCIIVVEFERELVGILVDTISEVVDITREEFDEMLFQDQEINKRFIRGIGKINGKIKILLDITAILSYDEAGTF